jgi:hypothetical protein
VESFKEPVHRQPQPFLLYITEKETFAALFSNGEGMQQTERNILKLKKGDITCAACWQEVWK